jgi:hypothetical protein
MSATAAQNVIAVVGIDIGKNSFHVVALDDRGAIALRQKWSRGRIDRLCITGCLPSQPLHHLVRPRRNRPSCPLSCHSVLTTWWPAMMRWRAMVLPTLPAPINPICILTAPALSKVTNENFVTFSFRQQLSVKLPPASRSGAWT